MYVKPEQIMRFGESELFSANGPESGHILLIKQKRGCVSNSAMFMTLIRRHARAELLDLVLHMLADRFGDTQELVAEDQRFLDQQLKKHSAKSITPSLVGIQYPILLTAMSRGSMHYRATVSMCYMPAIYQINGSVISA